MISTHFYDFVSIKQTLFDNAISTRCYEEPIKDAFRDKKGSVGKMDAESQSPKTDEEKLGYKEVAKKNGMLSFMVHDLDGLDVYMLSHHKNMYGKPYTKRTKVTDYQVGMSKHTNSKARLYKIAIHAGDFEIKHGETSVVIKNSYDKEKWK